MSQENVENVLRAFEAFARGGPEAMIDFFDPEIELRAPSDMAQGGTFRGHAAVLDWMLEWAEAWEEIDYKPGEFTDAGDALLFSVLYDGRGKGSGVRVEAKFWYLMKVRNGKVCSLQLFAEKAQALEAAALRE